MSTFAKCRAWGVHLYSMLGLVASAIMGISIVDGRPEALWNVFLMMWIATIIDATDGFLARKARVKEVLPGFDGRRLDDLIDFLNYTYLPLLLLWRAGILPAPMAWIYLIPLLSSIYGFSQSDAKTEDGFFLGFPSYWNLIAYFLFNICPSPAITVAILLFFSGLTFVPARYVYSTQPGAFNRFMNALALSWAGLLIWLLFQIAPSDYIPGRVMSSQLGSLFYTALAFPVYYLCASWWITLRILRTR